MRRPFLPMAVLAIALAGCGKPDPIDDKARNTAGLPRISATAPSPSGEPRGATGPAKASPAPSVEIPASLQGRWGLTPADCTTALGDAKGLLVINPHELRFYESRAVPAGGVEADVNSIAGNFAFTGEGQSWTKYEALKVNKQVLVRTETEPMASFSYAKCS